MRVARGEAVAREIEAGGFAPSTSRSRGRRWRPRSGWRWGRGWSAPGDACSCWPPPTRPARADRPRGLPRRPAASLDVHGRVPRERPGRTVPRETTGRHSTALLEAELEALAALDRRRACPEVAGSSACSPDSCWRSPCSRSARTTISASPPTLPSRRPPRQAAARRASAPRPPAWSPATSPPTAPSRRRWPSFLDRPAALVFPTGYQTNLGVVTALAGRDDLIVSDALNHASLIDGCRLSRARVAIYPHGDAARRRRLLAAGGPFRRRLLVTESLFSMDGDVAPLAALADAAAATDAILVVDEAHAFGVLGPGGRGLCAAAGVVPDVLIGTLGKAFGAAGGFVAGARALRDLLVNRARTFIYTTALPPAGRGRRRRRRRPDRRAGGRAPPRPPGRPRRMARRPRCGPRPRSRRAPGRPHRSRRPGQRGPRPRRGGGARARAASSSPPSAPRPCRPARRASGSPCRPPTSPTTSTRLAAALAEAMPMTHRLRGLFVTGTDTGVGKTLIAAGLLRYARRQGRTPIPFKPVETGCDPEPADARRLWRAAGSADPARRRLPARPSAPGRAGPGRRGGRSAGSTSSRSPTAPAPSPARRLPPRRGRRWPPGPVRRRRRPTADLAARLGLPLLVVARTALGTINHTALTLAEAAPPPACRSPAASSAGPSPRTAPHESGNARAHRRASPAAGRWASSPHLPADARDDDDRVADAVRDGRRRAGLRLLLG